MKRLKARHRSFVFFEAPVEKAKAERPEKARSKLGGFGAQDEEDVTIGGVSLSHSAYGPTFRLLGDYISSGKNQVI